MVNLFHFFAKKHSHSWNETGSSEWHTGKWQTRPWCLGKKMCIKFFSMICHSVKPDKEVRFRFRSKDFFEHWFPNRITINGSTDQRINGSTDLRIKIFNNFFLIKFWPVGECSKPRIQVSKDLKIENCFRSKTIFVKQFSNKNLQDFLNNIEFESKASESLWCNNSKFIRNNFFVKQKMHLVAGNGGRFKMGRVKNRD